MRPRCAGTVRKGETDLEKKPLRRGRSAGYNGYGKFAHTMDITMNAQNGTPPDRRVTQRCETLSGSLALAARYCATPLARVEMVRGGAAALLGRHDVHPAPLGWLGDAWHAQARRIPNALVGIHPRRATHRAGIADGSISWADEPGTTYQI